MKLHSSACGYPVSKDHLLKRLLLSSIEQSRHCCQIFWCSFLFVGYFCLEKVFSSVQSLSCVQLFVTHELQHSRPPCLSPTARACLNSGPSSRWCHPTISSSVVSFSSCLRYFPASRSFPMSQFFTSGGQSIGVSASASVLSMNIQDWFPLGLTGFDLLAVQGTLKESSPTPV